MASPSPDVITSALDKLRRAVTENVQKLPNPQRTAIVEAFAAAKTEMEFHAAQFDDKMDKPQHPLMRSFMKAVLEMPYVLTDNGEPVGCFPTLEDMVSFGTRRLTPDAELMSFDCWLLLDDGGTRFLGCIG